MNYSFENIAQIVNGKIMSSFDLENQISHVVYDSRKIVQGADAIFFAFKSSKNDGHQYIKDAYQRGVRNFCVSDPSIQIADSNVLLVNDTLSALQSWSTFHRKQFSYPVIAITGSNGKTMIKEWLFQLLHQDYNIVRSPKSFNSQIGVPLSVLKMDAHHDLAIIEAGISKKGEMKKLEKIIQPKIVVISNIRSAHDEGFDNHQEKLEEKYQLTEHCDLVIFNDHHEIIKTHVLKTRPSSQYLSVKLHQLEEYRLNFVDSISKENISLCVSIMKYLGISEEQIQERLLVLEPVKMRLELERTQDNCILINDAYNADLDSLKYALEFLVQQKENRKTLAILSSFSETGLNQKEVFKKTMVLLEEHRINELFILGVDESLIYENDSKVRVIPFSSRAELSQYISLTPIANTAVLIKGARQFELESIFNQLSVQAHHTVLEIDLNAMEHNLGIYSSYLKSGTKIMAVIKAGAYGSGAVEVARFLQQRHVDYLAVARTGEAIELRKAGIQLPLVILNPEEISIAHLFDYQLEPEIYSITQLRSILSFGKKPIKIHLNLDTGMHRLGFMEDELPKLIKLLKRNPQITIASIFSHLSSSENAQEENYTKNQINLFDSLYQVLESHLNYSPIKHILNTAGIINFTNQQYDMVRIGLGLYGIDSTQKIQASLEKVHSLKSKIVQIKKLKKGDSIGYNRAEILPEDMTIATVPVGYADGLIRGSGNKKYALYVNGQKAPIIGHVSMDLCTIDISKHDQVMVGNEVVIFNKEHDIESLAEANNTIPYEILSRISDRVKRIFIQT